MHRIVKLDERTRFDRDRVISEIDLTKLTTPTRKRVEQLKRKKVLNVLDRCYLASIRDYLRMSEVDRKEISSRLKAGFASRLNQREPGDRGVH